MKPTFNGVLVSGIQLTDYVIKDIIHQYLSGDEEAKKVFASVYLSKAPALVRRYLRDEQIRAIEVQDVVQDVFIKLSVGGLEKCKHGQMFEGYLSVIIKNHVKDLRKKGGNNNVSLKESPKGGYGTASDPGDRPDRKLQIKDLGNVLDKAVDSLHDQHRNTISLYRKGYNVSEISTATGNKPTMVSNVLMRARKQMKKYFNAQLSDEDLSELLNGGNSGYTDEIGSAIWSRKETKQVEIN